MFTEALALVPAFIGFTVYGTLGLCGMIWFLTRPQPMNVADKTSSTRQ